MTSSWKQRLLTPRYNAHFKRSFSLAPPYSVICVRLENRSCPFMVALPRLLFFVVLLAYYEILLPTLTVSRDKVHQITGVPAVGDRLVLPDVLEYLPLG